MMVCLFRISSKARARARAREPTPHATPSKVNEIHKKIKKLTKSWAHRRRKRFFPGTQYLFGTVFRETFFVIPAALLHGKRVRMTSVAIRATP